MLTFLTRYSTIHLGLCPVLGTTIGGQEMPCASARMTRLALFCMLLLAVGTACSKGRPKLTPEERARQEKCNQLRKNQTEEYIKLGCCNTTVDKPYTGNVPE